VRQSESHSLQDRTEGAACAAPFTVNNAVEGVMDWLRNLLGGPVPGMPSRPGTSTVDDLARRLQRSPMELRTFEPAYRTYAIPKKGGGSRTIHAPDRGTRDLQRAILRRVLGRGTPHPAVYGFVRGRSAVDHARLHAGAAVVLRLDIEDFFGSTTATAVQRLFAPVWDAEALEILIRLTTLDGSLPQGAPTSPAVANRVNVRLDHRLAGFARLHRARYGRYADDLTFSLERDEGASVHALIRFTDKVLTEAGYRMHRERKLHIRRDHERQVVAGLVVNGTARPRLPRERCRWLRAVEHHRASGKPITLTDAQLDGWRAYRSMVEGEVPEVSGRR
jgi:hypothetical protein